MRSFSNLSILKNISGCLLFALHSCALIVAPTGGPKDTTPPKVEKESPPNKSTAFRDNEITIKFDEYVQIKDAEEQIVISPPMDPKPQFEVNGKSISATIRAELKQNTTYTINFGNGITDNHESNILGNYSYVFSTGLSIDTLSLKGAVYNAFNNKPEKGFSVCLYSVDSFTDSTIFKKRPFYFTKTTDAGTFTLNNLPAQSFKLVVFKDDNKNLKYDKNESIGFYPTIVNTTDSASLNTIFSFAPDAYSSNRLLDTFGREIGSFTFVVFKPTNYSVQPIQKTNYYSWYKKGKDDVDTLTLYSPDWKSDSVLFAVSTEKEPILVKPRRSNKTQKFEITIQKQLEMGDSISISFNHPYSTLIADTSKLKLKEDSVFIQPVIIESQNHESIKLYYPWKEKEKYSLELKDSVISDIYGQYSKKSKTNWTIRGIKDYSTLLLHLIHPGDNEQYIVQLMDESETKLFKTFVIKVSEDINLDYVIPGKYKVKIIRDANRNGKWDNGDYQLQQPPEKVFYAPEILTLRAYWDLEQTIDLKKIVN